MLEGREFTRVERLEDPRLDVYRDLKRTNRTRWAEVFVAEGRLVVERLLAAKQWDVESVLVSESRIERIRERLRPGVPVYVVSHAACSELVGFNFHAGLLACGRRRRLERVVLPGGANGSAAETLIACPQISMPDNLGAIIRMAAAFRMSGVVVGPMSADAFSRRVVRVSMGNVFGIPIYEPADFERELRRLVAEDEFEVVGAARSARAQPLGDFGWSKRTVLVMGNEATGLRSEWESICRREVSIEMSDEVDSLNVSTAAGILMYQLSRRGSGSEPVLSGGESS